MILDREARAITYRTDKSTAGGTEVRGISAMTDLFFFSDLVRCQSVE